MTRFAAAVWLISVAACDRPAQTPPVTDNSRRTSPMAKGPQDVPSFVETPQTPPRDGPGVSIALAPPAGPAYRLNAPIVLHGKYGVDAGLNQRAEGSPLAHVILHVGREREPDASARPVRSAHNAPPAELRGSAGTGEFVIYGCFNVDLRNYTDRLKEAGRYWVRAELFEHESEQIVFEVR